MSTEPPKESQWVRYLSLALIAVLIALIPTILGGCAMFHGQPRIKVGSTVITPPADAGKPATLATEETKTGIVIPQDTPVTLTKVDAVPATANASFQPAKWVYQFTPTKETRFEAVSATLAANTGTVDTTVALRKVEAAQRIWLLWTAIGCGVGGLVLRQLVPMWPGLSNGLLIGCPIAFAAWRFAEIPAWMFAAGIVITGLIALGYKRAEWDKNGNFIPDVLETK